MRTVNNSEWKVIPVFVGAEGETVALPRKLMLSTDT